MRVGARRYGIDKIYIKKVIFHVPPCLHQTPVSSPSPFLDSGSSPAGSRKVQLDQPQYRPCRASYGYRLCAPGRNDNSVLNAGRRYHPPPLEAGQWTVFDPWEPLKVWEQERLSYTGGHVNNVFLLYLDDMDFLQDPVWLCIVVVHTFVVVEVDLVEWY